MSSISSNFYRLLLRLLPAEFRQRWSADMHDALGDRLRAAAGSPRQVALVWVRALADIVGAAMHERGRPRVSLDDPPRFAIMAGLVQDARYALRTLRIAPGFSLAAIATLAIGVAAATATFSVVHPVLLRPPPYAEPGRLVMVWPETNANKAMVDLAAGMMPSLESVSGVSDWTMTLTGEGEPLELTGTLVSAHHFDLLGARPLHGRTFLPEEELPERAGVAILSYGLWAGAFGADPGIVGRVIELAGADHDRREVIGVMAADFEPLGADTQVWVPLQGDPALTLEDDSSWYVNARIARLAPAATLAQAGQEVRAYAAAAQQRVPRIYDEEQARTATVISLAEYRAGRVGPALWAALGAVSLVLLMACANLANLLLARGEARGRELAVRAALGAGGRRIGRLLLMETATLGLLGGVLGIAGAYGAVQALVSQAPGDFPGLAHIGVNASVLAYALGATLFSTFLAGLAPVRQAARIDSTGVLGGSARGTGASGRSRLGTVLVGVQVALALMIAVGSGLMLRSLGALLAVDPGIDPTGVIAFRPNPPSGRYETGLAYRDYYQRVSERVAAIPGIESVGAIHLLPGTSSNWSFPTFPEGVEMPEGAAIPSVNFRATRVGYFETVRQPLVAGRLLQATDDETSEQVVVVNQAFVREFWPGEKATGRSLRIFSPTGDPARVVGVVGDVRQHRRSLEPSPEMYFAHAQVPWDEMSLWIVARTTSGDALAHAEAIRAAVWDVDADVPIAGMQDLSDTMLRSTASTSFLATLLSGFGVIALSLGGLGIFGVTAYTVGRRVPEFGVRVALGSSRAGIIGTSLLRSLRPVGIGLLAGLAGALATAGFLESVLYGVAPNDPVTLLAVVALLGSVATLASIVPAWRASRVDPMQVLNSD